MNATTDVKPLTDEEALSLANKLSEEVRTFMSMFGSVQHLGELIQKAREAKKFLAESNVEAKIANAKSQIASLEKQYSDENRQINKDLNTKKADVTAELDDIQKQIGVTGETHEKIQRNLANHEIEVNKQIEALDHKVKEKEAELEKVTVAFEEFKRSHNL